MKCLQRGLIADSLSLVLIGIIFINFVQPFLESSYHFKLGPTQSQTIVMFAGQKFAQEGFLTHKLTPLIPVGNPDYPQTQPSTQYYTHFPPLPFYVGGILSALGVDTLAGFRLLNIWVTFGFLIGSYFFFKLLFNRFMGLVAGSLLVTHLLLYQIHLHSPEAISDFLLIWYLAFLVYREKQFPTNSKLYLLIASFLFLVSYASFEYIPFAYLSTFGLLLYYRRCVSGVIKYFTPLFFVPIGAQIMHFLNNAWVLGGIRPAFLDLYHAFLWRSVEKGQTQYLSSIAGGLQNYPAWLASQIEKYYHLNLGLVALMLGLLVLIVLQTRSKMATKLLFLLPFFIVSGVVFWLIFPQLTAIHFNSLVGRNFMLSYALFLAGSIAIPLKLFKQSRQQHKIAPLILALLGIYIVLVNSQKTLTLLSRPLPTWQPEMTLIQAAIDTPAESTLILTDSPNISKAAFLHQVGFSPSAPIWIQVIDDAGNLNQYLQQLCNQPTCFFLTQNQTLELGSISSQFPPYTLYQLNKPLPKH